MDKDTSDRILENAFKLWFGPEAERRINAGTLAPNARIWAAQVLMEVGSAPIVRLNDELDGLFHVRPAEGSTLPEVGSEMAFASIDEIEGITLTDEVPNAGHLTVVFTRKGYFLA